MSISVTITMGGYRFNKHSWNRIARHLQCRSLYFANRRSDVDLMLPFRPQTTAMPVHRRSYYYQEHIYNRLHPRRERACNLSCTKTEHPVVPEAVRQ